MSAISWFSGAEMIALGWTLLHFCWQGVVIAIAFAIVDRLTRRKLAATRYFLALCAFALMPLVVAITFANEMRSAPENPNVLISHSFTNASALKAGLKSGIPTIYGPSQRGEKGVGNGKNGTGIAVGRWYVDVWRVAIGDALNRRLVSSAEPTEEGPLGRSATGADWFSSHV